MIYITFNDSVSGVYQSQVIDTIRSLNKLAKRPITLVAFFSLRNFFSQRKVLKSSYDNSICIPLFPGVNNWKKNWITLRIVLLAKGKRSIIARGIFACGIALKAKKKNQAVCYDGRGAVTAECEEYNVMGGAIPIQEVKITEKNAVLNSNYRIAVTNKLLSYWKDTFGYEDDKHVVVPCTLGVDFIQSSPSINRALLSWADDDIVLAFSGSISGWQSLDSLNVTLRAFLDQNQKVKLLFMSKDHPAIQSLMSDYGNRVKNIWVNHSEVYGYLSLCDYGILIRDQSVTNQVASPVKYAEYLSAGLRVLISENLGDYSDITVSKELGSIIQDDSVTSLVKPGEEQKDRSKAYLEEHLTKDAPTIQQQYQKLIAELKV